LVEAHQYNDILWIDLVSRPLGNDLRHLLSL